MRALRILYPLFLLSGFCGLIYESIWAGYLKLFLGHAAYAQAVVLVVFIGGMAVGAWTCGRFAYRFRNPLAAYAMAEFAIGVAAMLFHRIFVGATDWAYASLLPSACSADGLCYASWAFAALLILPQSILLGTTFPLMAAGIMRHVPERAGRVIATLYFVNSLGAVFGVLTATFALVPWIGLPGASLTAGIANVLLAGIVYLYARSGPVPASIAPPAVTTTRAGQTSPTTLLVVALLTGLTSFVYEVIWIRMLSLVLGASTHAFEIMLASFILGLALGGAWIRGRIDRLPDARRFLANVQIAMGILAIGTLAMYNQMFELMAWLMRMLARNDSGYVLFNIASSVVAMAVMLPATVMAGMTLPLITQLLMRTREGERSIGYVYGWNTFGGIVGVLLAVHFGLPHFGLKSSLAAAALVDVAIGIYLVMGGAGQGRGLPRAAVVGGALVLFTGLVSIGDIDPKRIGASVYRTGTARLSSATQVPVVRDGKTATITIWEGADGVRGIQTNGKTEATINMTRATRTPDEHTQTLVGALPFAFEPGIRTVAIIGFGSGMTTSAVLVQPDVLRVDTIEIEPAMVASAEKFRPVVEAAFTDPRGHIIYDDARSYLARAGTRYDLIISEPSNPWVSGVASLFTREFYGRMKRSLTPSGMLVQWIQAYETNPETVSSIVRALSAEFRDFVVYQSGFDLVLVARATSDIGPLHAELFRNHGVRRMLAGVGIESLVDFEMRRVGGRHAIQRLLADHPSPVNSDYFPFVDGEAARARFVSSSAESLVLLHLAPLPIVELFESRPWGSEWPGDPGDYQVIGRPYASVKAAAAIRAVTASLDHHTPDAAVPVELASPVAALQATFVECVSAPTAAGLLDQVIALGSIVNRALPPERAAAFWERLAAQPCVAKAPERGRWISVFRAVAQRDRAAMSRQAEALLHDTASQVQAEYLILVGYAALRAQGSNAEADAFRARWVDKLAPEQRNSKWMRAIAGLTPDTVRLASHR